MKEEAVNAEADYLLHRVILNLEEERVLGALYCVLADAQARDRPEKEYFLGLLRNVGLIRKIGYIDSLKANKEMSVDYYDKDRKDDTYPFDAETELELIIIKEKIIYYVSQNMLLEKNPLGFLEEI